MKKGVYCAQKLDEEKYKAFVYAVKNHYWYQMYIDDLPIWGVVGEVRDNQYYIWTHKKFEIGYNGKQIIDVNLTSEDKVLLKPNVMLEFKYEVIWKPTNTKFEDRFDKYLDHNFFQHRVRIKDEVYYFFSNSRLYKKYQIHYHKVTLNYRERLLYNPSSHNSF